MSTAQGIVKVITDRPAGRGTAYNFCLEDGTWYGFGFTEPKFSRGNFIKFTYEVNGNFKNVDNNSVEIVEDTAPVVHTADKPAGTNWDAKDRRITFLACRKDAIELTKLGCEVGAIKLPAKEKFEALVSIASTLSEDLYSTIYGEKYPVHSLTEEAALDEE